MTVVQRNTVHEPCAQARKAHGRNELPEDPGTPFWKLVLKQFDDYLVKILIAAAVIDLLIALTGGDYSVGCVVSASLLLRGISFH